MNRLEKIRTAEKVISGLGILMLAYVMSTSVESDHKSLLLSISASLYLVVLVLDFWYSGIKNNKDFISVIARFDAEPSFLSYIFFVLTVVAMFLF